MATILNSTINLAKKNQSNIFSTDQTVTGSLYVSTAISGSQISGSHAGNGSQLTNLTASNIDNFGRDVRNVFLAGTGINITGTGNGPYTISTGGSTSETSTSTTTGITASAESFILCSGSLTGSIINIQLPLVSNVGNGKNYIVKNAGIGTVNILASGSNKIDGASSATITTTYSSYSLFGTGSNWWIY